MLSEDIKSRIFDFNTLTKLETINPLAFQKGLTLADMNHRLGFREEYLNVCLLFYYTKEELKDIILSEELKNLFETLQSLKFVENNPSKFKKEWAKIFFSKVTDVRIILAIFSDKVIRIMASEKSDALIKAIDEIYVPLSHVVGINHYISQFEDFVIRTKYSKEYTELLRIAKKEMLRDSKEVDEIVAILEKYRKYPDEKLYGRVKSPHSVFKKVYVRKEPLTDITDYVAVRIITKTEEDCYSWMGYIFSNWEPIIGKIKDYIEHPKPNGYKSIHTTVLTDLGPVEFQVRTEAMHEYAEYGIASHWRYKKQNSFGMDEIIKHKDKLFSESFNIGEEKIFVYTPNGDIVILDKDSCVLDFAYAIHTDLGNHAVRAIVNGMPAPLSQKLFDQNIIEIFTDKNKKPSRDWLEFVKTRKAIDKIKQELGLANKFMRLKKEEDRRLPALLSDASVAKCCNPFYDDEIVLYKTSKRKYVIHTFDCLLKANKKYEPAPEGLNKKLLIKRLEIQIERRELQNILNTLKRKIGFENIRIDESHSLLFVDMKFNSRAEYETVKPKIQSIPGIIEISLI